MKIKQIKRVCATSIVEDGKRYQFITSGFPNRSRDGKTFDSVDGMFGIDFISDLDYNEHIDGDSPRQGIECYMYIRKTPHKDYRKVWCYGIVKDRHSPEYITQYKPLEIKATKSGLTATVKHGSIRLDSWNENTYFPNKPSHFCFPVYMKVERINPIAKPLDAPSPKA